ncbi:MAG: lysophospholipid acyltransferase family protein [Pseudomonadota bacterium]
MLKFVVIPRLFKWVGSLIVMTCRRNMINDGAYQQRVKTNQPFVLCLWHDCSTMAGWVMRGSPVTVIVSASRDGEYVSRFANLMGIKTIRGSTSRNAGIVVKSGLKVLRAGRPLGITPDGPRGPRYRAQIGALRFAAMTQCPIIPMHIKASREWALNSWDRQTFPKPFSRINVAFGDPIYVTSDELEQNSEQYIADFEAAMMGNVAIASEFSA